MSSIDKVVELVLCANWKLKIGSIQLYSFAGNFGVASITREGSNDKSAHSWAPDHPERKFWLSEQNAEAVVGGNSKNSKTTAKKAGGLGNRKALDNITNKSTLHHETSLKKKHLPKEEFNIAEERFLHDHKKCIEAQKALTEPCFLDIVLPGHGNHINLSDSISHAEYPQAKQAKIYLDSTCDSLEPVELPMSEFLDQWKSPQSSPVHWDSPPSSPFTLQFEPVEFLLKPEKKMKI